MKRIFATLLVSLIISYPTFSASTGAFFNVSSNGQSVTISTTVPNHTYPNAGIKINSGGYSLTTSNVCTPNSNGYCLFSVSNTAPVTFTISGSTTKKLDITLCLNGKGPLTCQDYSVSENFAYVSNVGSTDNISLCTVNSSTNTFSNCVDSGANLGGERAQYLAVNTTGTFLYVTTGNSDVQKCTINPNTRQLSACATTGSGIGPSGFGLQGITLNASGTLAYVASYEPGLVYKCPVNSSTGALGACVSTLTTDAAEDIALNSSNTFAYITIGSGPESFMQLCSIDTNTGSITSCQNANYDIFAQGVGIALNSTDTLAYVTNANGGSVSYCAINPQTGNFTNCSVTLPNGSFLQNVVTAGGPSLNLAETFIYFAHTNTSIFKCTVNSRTGALSGCVDSGVGNVFNRPVSIVFIR